MSYEVGLGEEEANSKFMQKEMAFSSKKTSLSYERWCHYQFA